VSDGERAVAGHRGKKSHVKTVDSPSLKPSHTVTSSLAAPTDAVVGHHGKKSHVKTEDAPSVKPSHTMTSSLAAPIDAVSWSSSLDVGANVKRSTSSDGRREVTQPTIKLGKC